MGVKKFNLPDPGEGLVEADIVTWRVKPGEEVKVNDIVVEIETAKSLVELPIPWAGKVLELLVAEGDTVDVGAPIVAIDVVGAGDEPSDGSPAPVADAVAADDAAASDASGTSVEPEERVANLVGYGAAVEATGRRARRSARVSADGAPRGAAIADNLGEAAPVSADGAPRAAQVADNRGESQDNRGEAVVARLAKPPVRKFAKDHGVDLAQVTPTGPDGIVTRADVEGFLAGPSAADSSGPATAALAGAADGEHSAYGQETRIPVKGVRKMTAQAMVGSAFSAPHVTEFVTVDITRTMELVERLKADRDFRGVKVTPLLVLARALCIAIQRHPQVNASWDEASQEIVVKHYVNLGIAASTPRGLVVPNIKDADRMPMRQLADALGSLVETAREGRTPPADMSGGTITITNVGVFGVDSGTPIINPGEAAILCFGAVRKMPWVVEGPEGDRIVPRQVTQLGLSFDHRMIDGDLGSRFLADIAALLEDPARALVWG